MLKNIYQRKSSKLTVKQLIKSIVSASLLTKILVDFIQFLFAKLGAK